MTGWRALQGATAKASGGLFEQELSAGHEWYAARGLAAVAKNHAEVGGPPGRMFFSAAAQVDYTGTALGKPIAFDAKSKARAASLKVPTRDAHQLAFLLRTQKAGGCAFYLRACPVLGMAWIIDDLRALAAGTLVTYRGAPTKDGLVYTHHFPVVHRSSVRDIARGLPVWDWLPVVAARFGLTLPTTYRDLPAIPLPGIAAGRDRR